MFPTHADIQAALSTARAHADTYGDGNKAGILARVIRELEQVGPELFDAVGEAASAKTALAEAEKAEEPTTGSKKAAPTKTPLLKTPVAVG